MLPELKQYFCVGPARFIYHLTVLTCLCLKKNEHYSSTERSNLYDDG